MESFLIEPPALDVAQFKMIIGPTGMIEHHHSVLPPSLVHRLLRFVAQHRIGILDEKRIDMSHGLFTSDFTARDHKDSQLFAALGGNTIRLVQIAFDLLAVRAVFEVVGDGDDVEPVAPCFVDPHVGPHFAVGEHCVDVKIPRESFIPRNVGQTEFIAGVEGIPLGEFVNMFVTDLSRCNHGSSGQQNCQQDFFHRFRSMYNGKWSESIAASPSRRIRPSRACARRSRLR